MNDSDLIEDALALKKIDQSVVVAIVNDDMELFFSLVTQFRQTKIRLKTKLAESSTISAKDPQAKAILHDLDSGRAFHTDDAISVMEADGNYSVSLQELTDYEINELGSKLLYTWISHHEYVRDLFKISTLIISKDAPECLSIYIKEAKNCYAFQQYNAVLALSRTILEAAAKDLCFHLGYLDKNGKACGRFWMWVRTILGCGPINPKIFNQLISAVSSGKIKGRAKRLYYDSACPVVHGDKVVTEKEAATVFNATIALLQELYSTHGL